MVGDHKETDDNERIQRRRRLKQARMAKGLTPAQLARLTGRSASTVRAHENGQNGIGAEAAEEYALALNVSAAWILYGDGSERSREDFESEPPPQIVPASSARRVPVEGELEPHSQRYRTQKGRKPFDYIEFFSAEYGDFDLFACVLAQSVGHYPGGTVLILAPPEVGVRIGDHVLMRLRSREPGPLLAALYSVQNEAERLALYPLRYRKEPMSAAKLVEDPEIDPSDRAASLLGVVVGAVRRNRLGFGFWVRPDRLDRLVNTPR